MNLIKQFTFDDNLYERKNIFCITSKDFFEGGFDINATLEEKHRLQYEEPSLPVFGGYSGV